MAGPDPENRSSEQQQGERRSVLSELPRTRPQRPSRRRESARPPAKPAPAKPRARAKTGKRATQSAAAAANAKAAPRPKTRSAPRRRRAETELPSTPAQGYAAETDLAGGSVSPPSGAELVGALAELAGELAQAGLSAGGRLVKGALSRISGA